MLVPFSSLVILSFYINFLPQNNWHDHHDISDMLWKVALNTITLSLYFVHLKYNCEDKTLLGDGLAFYVVITYFENEGNISGNCVPCWHIALSVKCLEYPISTKQRRKKKKKSVNMFISVNCLGNPFST